MRFPFMQLFVLLVGCAACAASARAQSPKQASGSDEVSSDDAQGWAEPADGERVGRAGDGRLPRVLVTVGVGLPVRMRRDRRLGQGRLAPLYSDLFAAYLFPDLGGLQHGLGLTASIGLSEDGGFYEPTQALSQVLLAPTYVLSADLWADLATFGHVAVPVSVSGGTSVGLDVGATAAYRLLAGAGIYGELSASAFVGVAGRIYPMVALELGVMVDYEVLP